MSRDKPDDVVIEDLSDEEKAAFLAQLPATMTRPVEFNFEPEPDDELRKYVPLEQFEALRTELAEAWSIAEQATRLAENATAVEYMAQRDMAIEQRDEARRDFEIVKSAGHRAAAERDTMLAVVEAAKAVVKALKARGYRPDNGWFIEETHPFVAAVDALPARLGVRRPARLPAGVGAVTRRTLHLYDGTRCVCGADWFGDQCVDRDTLIGAAWELTQRVHTLGRALLAALLPCWRRR